jgi:ketosteroid isomerase-like protein
MSPERYVRQRVPPARDRRRRTLDERLTLRFPRLAAVARGWVLGLRPDSWLRRRVMPISDRNNHEAINRRDWGTILMNFDPDIRLRMVRDPRGGAPGLDLEGEYRGHEGMRDAMERFDEAWEDWHLDTGEIIDFGDRHLCLCRYVARGRASGVEVDHPVAHVITVRDRRIVAMDFYWSQQQALEAVGLVE